MAVITVSRQLGSIGDLVARRASEVLSYDFVDKNLITEVAREANVPESEVEKFDEQAHSAVKRFIHSLIVPSRSVPTPPAMLWGLEFPYEVSATLLAGDATANEERHLLDQRDYLRFLQATVHRLRKRDRVTIVGRGGQAILRDDPNTLHVRTVAPLEDRIRVVLERQNLRTRKEASDLIQKSDRRRAAYLRDNYQIDWDDPALYHVVVNTGRTCLESAALIIQYSVDALGRA
ncbi:MAG: cytidylate kinase-like family protein [Gemmatimonadetes bacterium]|nr:cytidylate kinase-like family protein [Gemmatimonadota bacterium]